MASDNSATNTSFPPYHTTLPHLTKDNWREHAAKKKQSVIDAIPQEWRIDVQKYADRDNVINVPEETGLLTSKELEITDIEDANLVSSVSATSYKIAC